MPNEKMTGYKDGGSAAKGAKAVVAAIKRLRMESGAAISEKEVNGIVKELLREESGAAISKAEREAVKKTVLNAARQKPRKMNMGGMTTTPRQPIPQAAPRAPAPAPSGRAGGRGGNAPQRRGMKAAAPTEADIMNMKPKGPGLTPPPGMKKGGSVIKNKNSGLYGRK